MIFNEFEQKFNNYPLNGSLMISCGGGFQTTFKPMLLHWATIDFFQKIKNKMCQILHKI